MSLYSNLFYSSDVQSVLSDEATLAHMLRFEATLAQVQGQHKLIPATSAEIIAECCQVKLVDFDDSAAPPNRHDWSDAVATGQAHHVWTENGLLAGWHWS